MKDNKFISPDINKIDELSSKLVSISIELENSNKKLSDSQKARTQILENISHDLRSPIVAIRGAVDRLLYDNPQKDESAKLLNVINNRLTSLESLIEELYLSQKLNQPEFTLSKKKIEFVSFLEEYYIQLEISDRLKGRDCKINIPNNTSIFASVDVQLLLRVFDNIITNAIYHTKENDIISILLSKIDNQINIVIKDSGMGIAKEHLPHIFERTFTTSTARTPEKSGSGLGLYIAKTIIEKHGGNINCESEVDQFTKFTINLLCDE